MPLPAGRYRCRFHLDNPGTEPVSAVCDVYIHGAVGTVESKHITLRPGRMTVEFEFEVAKLEFGLQFRCISVGEGPFLCRRLVDFEPLTPHDRLHLGILPMTRDGEAGH